MPTILEQISPAAWEHPTDRAALGALKTIPGFDSVLRKVIGMFGERNIRINYQAQALRVGPSQYPDLYRMLVEACERLDTDIPPLYVSQTPLANAGAIGMDHPFIVLNSSLIELSRPEEIQFILGHELAHILSDHALYRTLLFLLLDFTVPVVPVVGQAAMPITLALLEWHRKSEVSCDRAGLLTVQDADIAYGALGVMAGGVRGREGTIDIAALRDQSNEYLDAEGLDAFFKFMSTAGRTHPFPVIRVAELSKFIEGGPYTAILDGDYVRRGEEPPLLQDLEQARQGFSDSAQRVFANADKHVNRTLTGWARKVRG
ncbi:MAG: M48 family metallopeptidase [Actinomycetia bacterium]|nr:M48 family metallopeptidase [Actinomycetes bacterium]MCP5034654.1 M48 family metallopeptidase [Actinomycetes bacterium]